MWSSVDKESLEKIITFLFTLTILSILLEFYLYLFYPSPKIMIFCVIFGIAYPIMVMKEIVSNIIKSVNINKND